MFYYVYILRNQQRRKSLYIGYTANLIARIKEHNQGRVASTKKWRPWKLVYYEAYRSENDARKRERKLKQFKNSYKELTKRISQSIALS